ncbi:MAG: ShlB/FhaC/HecB family hemolysin secretion/activation protein [Leptolyngbya sp. SIO4C1]|nr:ShlB/FhaC/HecB family hemolysin secretion/activation protein [Leptolyngbya sp. SIO4C1]
MIISPAAGWAQTSPQTLERVDPPAPEASPDPPPEAPDSPEDLLPEQPPEPPAETPSDLPPGVLATEIRVTELRFEGNEILSNDSLQQAILEALARDFATLDPAERDEFACEPPFEPPVWTPVTQTVAQLLRFAEVVAACYAAEGYTTSGAVIQIPTETRGGTGPVDILVIEGELESVDITGRQRLNEGYVRSRLHLDEGQPLNIDRLQENLQLLQIDPLVQQIRAELNAGAAPGSSRLLVDIEEARSFDLSLALDNSRPVSVGTAQQQVFARESNLLGIGDALSLGYTHSEGSDALSVGYSLPINARDGRLSLRFDPTRNDIVDADFFDINRDGEGPDIESRSQLYEISLRQPVMRRVDAQTFQELAIGLSGSLRNSQSFLLGDPFPLSPGASVTGKTRVVALRFFQDYTLRDARQVFSARSQFSLGLGILDATVNNSVEGVGAIPDSRFFAWQGQLQWAKVLAPDTLLLLRSDLQLADQVLLSAEQFSLGGASSVRGYRQDQLLTDNGLFASAEVRLPVARIPTWNALLQVTPFIDFGTGWNSSGRGNPDENTLASVGLGLQLLQGDRNQLTARLDWGIPLISVDSGGNSWQEKGLYFSVVYNPF